MRRLVERVEAEISALVGIIVANFERRAAKVDLPGLTAGVEAVIRERQ